MTMVQVLGQGGGGLNALGRHVVAALLNSTSPGVDYTYTQAQVIQMFQAVYPGTNAQYEALKDTLARENERGCDPKVTPTPTAAKVTPTPTAAGAIQGPSALPRAGGPMAGATSGGLTLAVIGLFAAAGGAWWALRPEASRRS
jgi:hypothetical protein